jgi:hypothetical protein
MKGDFYICQDYFHKYEDLAVDWLLRSFRKKYGSDEWQICRLKYRLFRKKSLAYLKESLKYL